MKKILYMLGALLAAVSCNLDKFPSDALSSESMKDPSNSTVVTDGTYAMFKAILMYDGMVYSANSYVRHYFQMAEFRGDNITLCGYTTDPLNSAIIYKDVSTEGNTGYFWWIAYKILFSANAMIDAIPEDGDAVSRHILGENYFIRAVVHLHLLQIYSFPYSHGRDNLGVVLRTSTDCSETHRSTVGECYDQVEADLKKAAELMKGGSRRGNNGYASYEAAMGILSRVYLYEERWQDCIDVVDEVLAGADPASKLDPDYENLFWKSKTSKEVLWCVAMIPSDWTDQKGSMGSMFYSYSSETGTTAGPGAGGWGEIYYSQPLIDLFNRYPQDLRYRTMAEPYQHNADRKMVYWPIADASTDYRSMWSDTAPTRSADGAYVCKGPDGGSYTVKTRIVNTYPETYITYGGEDIKVSVSDQCYLNRTFPTIYMKKFANMDGGVNVLNSPIVIRWAEVILNRAEAYAHLGNTAGALQDVKVIRERAGLTGEAEMTAANMAERGYDDIVDLVLDERRMELCFEGHRPMDQFRNKKSLDRRYGGCQPWGVIAPDDKRIPYQIPYGEVSVSHIPQNER
ncbi:MAG: RagB/SusD family nutrient uptake outer membrane protein [Bacteroidales bacterium]|nr:RagB/SusD family nutrient uptake outer membrane protein [Bacteroidales bacterium]